ncbi:hypothetical protein [Calycomorphotria hydatis]|uniref:Uncharacterized protein n=1 Tax=Calycomorphotria hydatis TaxID=2528027 RepID=A0A517TAJ7_9PLAN|nr:hypothetical protein [Calycomorphotria hydatis]QDT65400.1 hypothetical protein V22_26530 [Calycomorphotria hydatis]
MARATARAANPVSLFPFLAVLLCAMGALILLLVIMTRHIHDTRQQSAKEPESVEAPPDAIISFSEPIVEEPAEVISFEPDWSKEPPLPIGEVEVKEPADVQRVFLTRLKPALPPPPDPNEPLRWEIQTLKQQVEMASQSLTDPQANAVEMKNEIATGSSRLATVKAAERERKEQLVAAQAEADRVRNLLHQAQNELTAMARQFHDKADQRSQETPKFSIVPFDGATGTTKRPILLECSKDGIRFVNEDIMLTASDLDGFNAVQNPIQAGVTALNEYWTQQDTREPYVLLLVRPEGTIAYYAARMFLQEYRGRTGYELIPDDIEIAPDAPDAEAKERVLTAIRSVPRPLPQVEFAESGGSRGRLDPIRVEETRNGFQVDELYRDPTDVSQKYLGRGGRDPRGANTGNGRGFGNGRDNTNPYRDTLAKRQGTTGQPPYSNGSFQQDGSRYSPTTDPRRDGKTGQKQNERNDGLFGDAGEGESESEQTGEGGVKFIPTTSQSRQFKMPRQSSPSSEHGSQSNGEGTTDPESLLKEFERELASGGSGSSNQRPPLERGFRQNNPFADLLAEDMPSSTSPSETSRLSRPEEFPLEPAPRADGQSLRNNSGQQRNRSQLTFGNAVPSPQGSNTCWGECENDRSLIGLERTMTVKFFADHFQVGNQQQIPLGRGETADQLQQVFLAYVNKEAKQWGDPPGGFRWVPRLNVAIMPGGNQHFMRINPDLSRYGLSMVVRNHLADPASPEQRLGGN